MWDRALYLATQRFTQFIAGPHERLGRGIKEKEQAELTAAVLFHPIFVVSILFAAHCWWNLYINVYCDLVAIVLLGFAFICLRVFRDPNIAGHVALASGMMVCSVVQWMVGGISRPAYVWVYIIPIFAVLLVGVYGQIFWASITLISVIGLIRGHLWIIEVGKVSEAYAENMAYSQFLEGVVMVFCLSLTIHILRNQQSLILESVRDTQKKLSEEIAERNIAERHYRSANQAKSTFLATMSHEIRTPMNGIVGMTEIMQNVRLPDNLRILTQILHDSSQSLLNLLNNILDLSKLDSGALKLEQRVFNIQELIHEVTSLVSSKIDKKQIQWDIYIAPDVPEQIVADSFRFCQTLVTLLSHAVGCCSGRCMSLIVKVQEKELKFVIHPSINVSDKELKTYKLLKPIDILPSQDSKSCLSIPLAQRLIQLMGRGLYVCSEPIADKFYFYLGFDGTEDSNILAEHTSNTNIMPREDVWVLAVDDNAVNRLVCKRQLEKLGYKCVLADSGRSAFTLLNKQKIDVILLDLQMPEADGYAVFKELRNSTRSYQDVAVVALTADDSVSVKKQVFEAGMNGFLSKPLSSSALDNEVQRVLTTDDCVEESSFSAVKILNTFIRSVTLLFVGDHEKLQRTQEEKDQAELIARVLLAHLPGVLLFLVLFIAQSMELFQLYLCVLCISFVFVVLSARCLKSFRNPLWAGNMLMLGACCSVVFGAWTSGGAEEPGYIWVYMLPLMTGIAVGPKGVVRWSFITVILVLGILNGGIGPFPIVRWVEASDHESGRVIEGVLWVVWSMAIVSIIRVLHKTALQKTRKSEAALAREVQQRRKAQQMAEQAYLGKTRFLETISHAIRTPMNGILGVTEVLLGSQIDQNLKVNTRTIRSSTKSLLILLDDILDLSKVESGDLELEDELLDIHKLIYESLDLFAQKAQSKGLKAYCDS